jgi:Endonuclease NucS
MLERDLQNYLFENPDILFPGLAIASKRREVLIGGLRIDLLFEIDGTHFIVELKRDTIKRADIGQIFEYYALMCQRHETATFRMILVAPSIPDYRKSALETFGIRCVEVKSWPQTVQDVAAAITQPERLPRTRPAKQTEAAVIPDSKRIRFEDLAPPVTQESMAPSHQILRDGLLDVERAYSAEYEIVPIQMVHPRHPDVLFFSATESTPNPVSIGVGAWWAYALGHSEEMQKNDVPNISVNALPWGLDFAVNAELRTSQKVMRDRIASQPERFNRVVAEHGALRFQAWLKIEFQPRIYHWIVLSREDAGSWRGSDIIERHRLLESAFLNVRDHWIAQVKVHRPELTSKQISHMESTNKNLNLALRLVDCVAKDDEIWRSLTNSRRSDSEIRTEDSSRWSISFNDHLSPRCFAATKSPTSQAWQDWLC